MVNSPGSLTLPHYPMVHRGALSHKDLASFPSAYKVLCSFVSKHTACFPTLNFSFLEKDLYPCPIWSWLGTWHSKRRIIEHHPIPCLPCSSAQQCLQQNAALLQSHQQPRQVTLATQAPVTPIFGQDGQATREVFPYHSIKLSPSKCGFKITPYELSLITLTQFS